MSCDRHWKCLRGLARQSQERGSQRCIVTFKERENWGGRPLHPSRIVAGSSDEFSIRSRISWSNISKEGLSGCVALGQKLGGGEIIKRF